MEYFHSGYRSELEGQYFRSTPHQTEVCDKGALYNAHPKPEILSVDSFDESVHLVDACQEIAIIPHNIFPSIANGFGAIIMEDSLALHQLGILEEVLVISDSQCMTPAMHLAIVYIAQINTALPGSWKVRSKKGAHICQSITWDWMTSTFHPRQCSTPHQRTVAIARCSLPRTTRSLNDRQSRTGTLQGHEDAQQRDHMVED